MSNERETVVLLHGLARTRRSMTRLARHLEANGYETRNIGYPSTRYAISELSRRIGETLQPLVARGEPLHFVTHSMGGILLRQMRRDGLIPLIGRVVMISPPNAGSEVVDCIRHWRLFRWLNGPAGQELGTEPESVPNRLGPADFELGVIAGDRSVDFLLDRYLPPPHDGKVAVARTRLAGMRDFAVVHATHPFIMRDRAAMELTLRFIREGSFKPRPLANSQHSPLVSVVRVASAAQREALRSIRMEVFVAEQGVPASLEMDEADALSTHALACLDGAPVGTGRIQPDGHIGRVAVLRPHRGQGIGLAIMRELIEVARETQLDSVWLASQTSAAGFYERQGFVRRGPVYREAGIDHVDMTLRLSDWRSQQTDEGAKRSARI